MVVAHIGARRYYAIPRIFHEAGVLASFHTDIFLKSKLALTLLSGLDNMGFGMAGALKGRHHPGLVNAIVKDYKRFGLVYWWSSRRTLPNHRMELFTWGSRSFSKYVLKHGLSDANVIYAFQGAALEFFKTAGANTLKILDQNLVNYDFLDGLLKQERQLWKGWESEAGCGNEHHSPMIDRQHEEWIRADMIVVPSDFVAGSLKKASISNDKLNIIPYPTDLASHPYQRRSRRNGPLRVVFVGTVSLRKGIPYLLQAAAHLGPRLITLRVVGAIQVDSAKLRPYGDVAAFAGAVSKEAVKRELARADVLCLPSLGEGQALVTNEALASGLPVVCTPNTGSRVRDSVDGTIIPIRDLQALIKALERYAVDREYLCWQSEQAIKARHRLGYPAYRETLLSVVSSRFHALERATS